MKKAIFIIVFFFLFLPSVFAAEEPKGVEELYKEQAKISGADQLEDGLPNETKNALDRLGIEGIDWNSFSSLTPDKIFSEIVVQVKNQSPAPFQAMTTVLAIMLLSALLDSMKLSFGDRPLSGMIGVISTLCICASIVIPIVGCIGHMSTIIQNAANFMLLFVPVMTGIMIAGGQAVAASSYHVRMVGAGEVISQISSSFLGPMLGVFLALSVVSSLSPKMNLSGACEMFHSVVKWVLSFVMSIFVSLLTIQSIVGTAADNTGTKTIKFAIGSFVPIVGGALSDAFATVQGCVKLLKSGVGAFGMIAAGVIFIPAIVECLVWMISISICASIGDIFELKQISGMLRASGKVISTMLVIILCCMMILIVSTVLILIIGGGAG